MRIENYESRDLVLRRDELETYKAREILTATEVILHALIGAGNTISDAPALQPMLRSVIAGGAALELLVAGELDNKLCMMMQKVPTVSSAPSEEQKHFLDAQASPPPRKARINCGIQHGTGGFQHTGTHNPCSHSSSLRY